MNVILTKEVPSLGNPGELVKVKNGYARNYLLPRGLAVRETPSSLALLEKQKADIQKQVEERKAEHQATMDKLAAVTDLKIAVRTGEDGKLFGTITSQQVADAIGKRTGIPVDKKLVVLRDHVKVLGSYTARVQLAKDFRADITFEVVAEA